VVYVMGNKGCVETMQKLAANISLSLCMDQSHI